MAGQKAAFRTWVMGTTRRDNDNSLMITSETEQNRGTASVEQTLDVA